MKDILASFEFILFSYCIEKIPNNLFLRFDTKCSIKWFSIFICLRKIFYLIFIYNIYPIFFLLQIYNQLKKKQKDNTIEVCG